MTRALFIYLTIYLYIVYSKIHLSINLFIQLFIYLFCPIIPLFLYLWLVKQKGSSQNSVKHWTHKIRTNCTNIQHYPQKIQVILLFPQSTVSWHSRLRYTCQYLRCYQSPLSLQAHRKSWADIMVVSKNSYSNRITNFQKKTLMKQHEKIIITKRTFPGIF